MKEGRKRNKPVSVGWGLIYCSVFITVLSQIELLSWLLRPLMYSLWGVAILLGCVTKKHGIKISIFTARFIISFTLYIVFCFISANGEQNYLRVLSVPLLLTVVSDLYIDQDGKRINSIVNVYILSAFVYAVWVHLTYFRSYSLWLLQRSYAFQQKNSAGQIWCVAAFLLIFYVEYRSKKHRITGFVLAAYFFVISGICQCRTSALATIVSILAFVISKSKYKIRWILTIALLAVVLWSMSLTREFFDKSLLLSRYQGTDINAFSSGRIGYWGDAIKVFLSSPIIGTGKYYVDCSYLSILAESGIIGLLLIENIWIKKVWLCFSFSGEKHESRLLFCLTVFYLVESCLEGYPPFGPGVSACIYWLISGLLYGKQRANKKSITCSSLEVCEY